MASLEGYIQKIEVMDNKEFFSYLSRKFPRCSEYLVNLYNRKDPPKWRMDRGAILVLSSHSKDNPESFESYLKQMNLRSKSTVTMSMVEKFTRKNARRAIEDLVKEEDKSSKEIINPTLIIPLKPEGYTPLYN